MQGHHVLVLRAFGLLALAPHARHSKICRNRLQVEPIDLDLLKARVVQADASTFIACFSTGIAKQADSPVVVPTSRGWRTRQLVSVGTGSGTMKKNHAKQRAIVPSISSILLRAGDSTKSTSR